MDLRITHVITSLTVGGAQKMLLRMASPGQSSGLHSTVICLGPTGPVEAELRQAGITVHHLHIGSVWGAPAAILRLRKLIKESQPQLIQGWMYHGNLAASIAAAGLDVPIVWNIRQSLNQLSLFKRSTRIIISICARLSGRAAAIIYNSLASREQHEQQGYASGRAFYIPNGVDVGRFAPDSAARLRTRQALGISEDEVVLICVARVHPFKAFPDLLRAMSLVAGKMPQARLIIVGRGASWDKPPFRDAEQSPNVVLIEETADVPAYLNAADLYVSASLNEGFPNSVLEAMAAGLPCVITDVGDSKVIVSDYGTIVSPGDPAILASAVVEIMEMPEDERKEMGRGARKHVENHYALDAIFDEYQRLYGTL